jgi:hypothetical protein
VVGGYVKVCACSQLKLTLNKRNKMLINFILFKVYIEKYAKRSDFKVTKDKYETVIDFGKYRLYVS